MKPIVFLDTEFTDFSRPKLLSLGMVSLDRHEHYVELDLAHPASSSTVQAASDFVRSCGVLDQWGRVPGAGGQLADMGRRTADWLLALALVANEPVFIAYDLETDYELMTQCIRKARMWGRVRAVVRPLNIGDHAGTFEGTYAAESAYEAQHKRGLERHHALADAHALRAMYLAVTTGRRVTP